VERLGMATNAYMQKQQEWVVALPVVLGHSDASIA
jgi:hypothetical protein